jgi:hypothetical protein
MLETLITASLLSLIMTVMYKVMLGWMVHELNGSRPAIHPSPLFVKDGKNQG